MYYKDCSLGACLSLFDTDMRVFTYPKFGRLEIYYGEAGGDQFLLWGRRGVPIRVTKIAWPFRKRTAKCRSIQTHA